MASIMTYLYINHAKPLIAFQGHTHRYLLYVSSPTVYINDNLPPWIIKGVFATL